MELQVAMRGKFVEQAPLEAGLTLRIWWWCFVVWFKSSFLSHLAGDFSKKKKKRKLLITVSYVVTSKC